MIEPSETHVRTHEAEPSVVTDHTPSQLQLKALQVRAALFHSFNLYMQMSNPSALLKRRLKYADCMLVVWFLFHGIRL